MIKLQDFAASKGVTDKAVYKHLNKHREELANHIEKRGKNGTWLDDFACDYISNLMISNPVVIGSSKQQEDIERLKSKLEESQDKLIDVLDKLQAYSEQIAYLQEENRKLESERLQIELKTASQINKLEQKMQDIYNRKLTLSERLKGKIDKFEG